jgi:hypothetical protein
MSTEQTPTTPWHVTVCVHQPITPAQADGLFDTLADAAHGWEPAGVDVDVSGGPCYCRQSPSGPSFGAALGAILGASGGASQAGEDQAGVDRAVRDALRHIGYDGPDADPATERDFDTAAAAAVPVTVVGTPPWQVHDSPPPTHGTPAADPPDGWDQEGWEGVSRAGAIRQAEAKHELSQQLFTALESVKQQLSTACADRDRYLALVRTGDRELAGVRDELEAARRVLAHGVNVEKMLEGERDAARAELAEMTAELDAHRDEQGCETAMAAQKDHLECPVLCELCGETLAATACLRCNGTGDIGADAYSECPECAGVGRIHEGCVEASYADLAHQVRQLRAEAAEARVDGQACAERDRIGREAMDAESRARFAEAGRTALARKLGEVTDDRDRLRAELATARRDAAADALLMVRRRFEESTDGDANIDTVWWLRWLEACAAEVRTGQRTISPQSATTTDDLPDWEQDIVFPATDTTEEP